jgi:hypothetical protein
MNEGMLRRKLLARLWVAILLTLALAPTAIAGEREPTTKNLQELEAEFAEIRKKPEKFRVMVAIVQMALGMYGFGTGPFDGVLDEKTRTALRKYQQVRQLPVTGDINAATLMAVEGDFKLFTDSPATLPRLNVYVDGWQDGYVHATGTWTIVGDEQADPEQTTDITCYKNRGTCVDVTAVLSQDNLLHTLVMEYPVERWDQYEITAKPTAPSSMACVAYTIRISRVSKAVTGYRMKNPDTLVPEVCKGLNPELQLKLTDGFDVHQELDRKRGEKMKGLLQAPGLRDKP